MSDDGHYYVIRAAPNGSCLFISLRLALEYHSVIQKAEGGNPVSKFLLDGRHPRALKFAEDLRAVLLKWYETGLDKRVDCFGEYEAGGRPWTRADIIANEIHELGAADVAQQGPARIQAAKDYIAKLKVPGAWGGVPEYTAFALMANVEVQVWGWTFADGKCTLATNALGTVKPPNPEAVVKLLYNGSNHYDLLIDQQDYDKILAASMHSRGCLKAERLESPAPLKDKDV